VKTSLQSSQINIESSSIIADTFTMAVVETSRMADPLTYQSMPAHQQEMLDACHSGNLVKLQQLFLKHNVERGDSPIKQSWVLDLTTPSPGTKRYILEPGSESGPPPTYKLFEAAAASKKPIIILFLLKTYPKFNFWDSGIMDAALTRKDVETFKAMYAYDKCVLDCEYDDHIKTALTESLEGGGTSLANFLLVDSAYVNNAGWLCRGGAITAAVMNGKSLEMIKKILEKRPDNTGVSCAINSAIHNNRVDVLKLFRERGCLQQQDLSDQNITRHIEYWEERKRNREMVAFLESCLAGRRVQDQLDYPKQSKQQRERESKLELEKALDDESSSIDENEGYSRKWWQIW